MQVSVESGEGLVKRLLVNLPADKVNELVDAKLKEAARTVRMDGFRPGKVPLRVVKQRYGEQVRQDAYGELIQSSFYEAATQENLRPVGEPSIELREDDADGGLAYTASFEVMPELALSDLSSLEIKRPVTEVTDADVDRMIEKLREQRTEWIDVDRGAQDGDRVTMDFTGIMDGEAFEGGSAEDIPLVLGSGTMIPGFEDGLVGVKAGDRKTLELKFPEDYRVENLAGKDVSFEVEVKAVAEPKLPEVDEAFIKALGVEEGTEEALRKEIRENMDREVRQKVKTRTKEAVMDALLAANEFDVPGAIVSQEAEALKKQTQQDMAQAGQQSSLDLPASVFEPQAERRVKLGLMVNELIRANEIDVDQARVDEAIAEQAATFEDPQEIINWYQENPQARSSVENVVMEDQVVDLILEKAKVEDETLSFDELLNNNQG
ncbi:trigger factor [Thiolapillus brandeum]|uniref:Trigger factor n=1 Tax=Thiolapillus brandeum TaxID=1076588 RepID=A0A7U6JGQ5_9GAMM|nr:trigger factor [Thiolapillus brandeum]BAO43656.1 trigger factor [Thiolapillus brandeum]